MQQQQQQPQHQLAYASLQAQPMLAPGYSLMTPTGPLQAVVAQYPTAVGMPPTWFQSPQLAATPTGHYVLAAAPMTSV
jgi:hypothetical protein